MGKRNFPELLIRVPSAGWPWTPVASWRLACPRLHVHLSLLPRRALHAPLRGVSDRAYGVPALQSSPWLPGAHVPHPPPALSSRQAPLTSLTSLSRIPTFPARRRRRNSRATMRLPQAQLCSPAHHSQSPHLSLIRNHRQPYKNLACTPLGAKSYHKLVVVMYRLYPTFALAFVVFFLSPI